MRTLVYIALGFAVSCGLWVYGAEGKLLAMGIGFLLALGVLVGRDGGPIRRAAAVALGCAAAVWWCGRYQAFYLAPAEAMDGLTASAEIRIQDYSEQTNYGTAVDGMIYLEEKPYQIRLYLKDALDCTPGDYLYGTFRFRVTTPAGAEESPYHQGKAIFLLAYQTDSVTLVDYEPTRRDIPARLRRNICTVIETCFPQDTAPFAKALLIGDTSDLDYEMDTNLKISGIRHVAAVSGLHVSILFALLTTVSFRNRWLMALLGYPLLLLFAAVAGFSPSVNRACLMSGLMLLGKLVNREYDGPSALAFAVLGILAANPLGIASVSLQLSVASVTGIYGFSEGIRKWLGSWLAVKKEKRLKHRLSRWLSSSISISLSAMILTTPLCAWYFGTVSLVSPLTNLLTLWVISFVFYGIFLVCLLFLWLPALAGATAALISWPIRYVLGIAAVMAKFPMAAVYTVSPYILLWLIFLYVLLLLFWIQTNRTPWLLSCCGAVGLCLALLASWWEPTQSDISFTVLDVGQGQCLVFQTEGKTIVVDCGGDQDGDAADRVSEFLLSQGISRIDALILTHLDRDHAGGAPGLLWRMHTEVLILPEVRPDFPIPEDVRVVCAAQDLELYMERSRIQIYPPTFPGNSNEMSICLLFDTEKCDILVTGDRTAFGERALLRRSPIPDVDVLVAGHHGSKHSTCDALLQAVRPEIVCISAGQNNSYGHPAPELLQRLDDFGCTIYRTDTQGTITIRR